MKRENTPCLAELQHTVKTVRFNCGGFTFVPEDSYTFFNSWQYLTGICNYYRQGYRHSRSEITECPICGASQFIL